MLSIQSLTALAPSQPYLVCCQVSPGVSVRCSQQPLRCPVTLCSIQPAVCTKVPGLASGNIRNLNLHSTAKKQLCVSDNTGNTHFNTLVEACSSVAKAQQATKVRAGCLMHTLDTCHAGLAPLLS